MDFAKSIATLIALSATLTDLIKKHPQAEAAQAGKERLAALK